MSAVTTHVSSHPGDEEGYESVTLTLMNDRTLEWWDISIAGCSKSAGDCQVLPMVIFNDKVSPPSLGFLAGYGYGIPLGEPSRNVCKPVFPNMVLKESHTVHVFAPSQPVYIFCSQKTYLGVLNDQVRKHWCKPFHPNPLWERDLVRA